ncbi:MAG: hypothetical protein K2L38_12405, partial [Dysosmobacter sp.]|nr:hypothetical protein [Dysosmobacter sp.]
PSAPAPLALLRGLLARLWTFGLCCFSLVFFRADSIGSALYILRHSADGLRWPIWYVESALVSLNPGRLALVPVLGSLLLLFAFDLANERGDAIQKLSARPVYIRWPAYTAFLLALVLLIPKTGSAPFIYFQF